MTRKLASIQKIVDIKPIKGADKIEVATVLGWQCVIAKVDNFKVGDLVVYIEIDTILPEKKEFEFLRDRKFRIKTIKLKGQVSQGLVVPLSFLPKDNYVEGQDVSEIIGVKKYDPEGEAELKALEEKERVEKNKLKKFLMRNSLIRKLFTKKSGRKFPEFMSKTDETRIQATPNLLQELQNVNLVLTEKLDGCSSGFYLVKKKKFFGLFTDYIFGVCSRNIHLPKEDNSVYWQIAKKYNIKDKLKKLIQDGEFVYIQGEIVGPKISNGSGKNIYELKENDLYIFNLVYPSGKKGTLIAKEICENVGLRFVPVLFTGIINSLSVSNLVELSKGKSELFNTDREGIVVRTLDGNISFKVINPDFLFGHDL